MFVLQEAQKKKRPGSSHHFKLIELILLCPLSNYGVHVPQCVFLLHVL